MSALPPDGFATRATARTERPLRLGVIDLSFHRASAGVVAHLLAGHGLPVVTHHAPHEAMFDLLREGEVDLLVSAWLPGSHGGYVETMQDQLLPLTVLYEPYALWGVPAHVPESDVASVEDLLKPAVLERMNRRIQGIGPGAGISRFSREIISAYRLDRAGYEFHHGTLDDCVAAFESAVSQRTWVVVPLWQPQFLHHRHHIRELQEPRGLLRGRDQATLLMRRDAAHLLPPAALQALQALSLGNAAVTALDDLVGRQGLTPDEAVLRWWHKHPPQPHSLSAANVE